MKDDAISRQRVLKLLSTIPPEEAMTKALLFQSVKQMDVAQPEKRTEERTEKHACDCISRKAAIDAVLDRMNVEKYGRNAKPEEIQWALEKLPSAQSKDWMEKNKERILQAGMEGREIEFRIGGRLFAIREKAQ